ncbi:protein-disulfide reductase DsbD family protein [Streptomyces sp. NBC_01264]|uniref:protein-disulfide reductase DsbD family protein n=1 Tax=Streptomyces sp. NBC_01264 TaxID=2903804 RepID=UPI002259B380|nr:protein-disulfide reductase DsbD family protein [Streptomyces sp. NBC_01264]MCX4782801.1 protein-disulfide reductase DsbD N-terminal domain-containing protein [Streptomyces sp. NBC_01264]
MAVAVPLRTRRARAGRARAGRAFAVALTALLTGCSGPGERVRTAEATPFTAGGVAVRVRAESREGSVRILAELRPEQTGFHLHGLDLPNDGIDGIGIPTRIRAEGGLGATGQATTDAKPRMLRPAGLDVALPVYADGTVTLELPVRRLGGTDRARVHLTYGACSETGGCLPPVRDHEVILPLDSLGSLGSLDSLDAPAR